MSDQITVDKEGRPVAFAGAKAVNIFRCRLLASSIGLYQQTGMIPTRGVTITKMLALATAETGKKYRRNQLQEAIDDLRALEPARVAEVEVIQRA